MISLSELTTIQERAEKALECAMCKGLGYYEMLRDDSDSDSLTKYECNACARSRPLVTDLLTLLAHIEVVGRRERELEQALNGVGWNDSSGKCWCDKALEETGLLDHSPKCLAARAVLSSSAGKTDR